LRLRFEDIVPRLIGAAGLTDEVRILGELAKIEEELVKLDSSRKPWPYTDTLKNAQEELIGMKTRLEELGESSETP
jgi:hypothetical protein